MSLERGNEAAELADRLSRIDDNSQGQTPEGIWLFSETNREGSRGGFWGGVMEASQLQGRAEYSRDESAWTGH